MKKYQSNSIVKLAAFFSVFAAIGCAPQGGGPGGNSNGSFSASSSAGDAAVPPAVATRQFTQVVPSMAAVTGVDPVSVADIKNYYKNNQQNMSLRGIATETSSSDNKARLDLAALFGKSFTANQKALAAANRVAFKGIDFNKIPKNVTDAEAKQAINELFAQFLQRQPTSDEVTLALAAFRGAVDQNSATNADTLIAFQVVAGGVLASFSFQQI